MIKYVLILPTNIQSILLVLKGKPEWQKGRLNLVGGMIEAGETPEEAGLRELKEEAGLIPYKDPVVCGKIIGDDFVVYCLICNVTLTWLEPRVEETEKVDWYLFSEIKDDPRLIPNLKVIIPLLFMGVTGWTIKHKTLSEFTITFGETT